MRISFNIKFCVNQRFQIVHIFSGDVSFVWSWMDSNPLSAKLLNFNCCFCYTWCVCSSCISYGRNLLIFTDNFVIFFCWSFNTWFFLLFNWLFDLRFCHLHYFKVKFLCCGKNMVKNISLNSFVIYQFCFVGKTINF